MDQFPQQNNGHQTPFVFAAPANQGEEAGFDFWGVLNRRKWLVFLGLVVGAGLGVLYNAQCVTIYQSMAKVKIEPRDPLLIQNFNNPILPTASDLMQRHDQLIGQDNVVRECLEQNKLFALAAFSELENDEIIPDVISNLEVTQNRQEPTLYELSYFCTDPADAATILGNLIATYEENLNKQYEDKSKNTEDSLSRLIADYTKTYADLQSQLNEIYENNPVPRVTEAGMTVHQVRLRELATEIENDKSTLAAVQKDNERATQAYNGGSEKIAAYVWRLKTERKIRDEDKAEMAQAMEKFDNEIAEYERQLRELSTRGFGPGHNRITALEKMLKMTMAERERAASLESELEKPLDDEEILRRVINMQNDQINDIQGSLAIRIDEYQRHNSEATRIAGVNRRIEDIKKQQDVVGDFIRTAKERVVELDSAKTGDVGANKHQGFRFTSLQNATYGTKVWPILPVILGIGSLLGALAGFGLGCLVELADKTFHNPNEIMKQLNVPLIGHIPQIGQSKRYLVENSLIEPAICTYHRPKSQASEAFRAVRTALYFNTQGRNHSVIQVTSPTPGDGKSTLAANLAVSIAQSGKSVLLVDADMRRPRQHGAFGITEKKGFATVLSGQSGLSESVYPCSEIPGLTLMPCGAKPSNPAELSSSPQVKELIEELRGKYDFVIMDTPPLLAVTDPCPIAARVDGVVLCLRIKKNVRVSAERSIEMLGNLGATCLGLVVNGVGAQSGYGSQYTYGAYRAGYSYNGYGYGYGYGTGKYYDDDKKGRQAVHNQPGMPGMPMTPPDHIEEQSSVGS